MTSTVRGPAARATSRLLIGRQEALARLDRALAEALDGRTRGHGPGRGSRRDRQEPDRRGVPRRRPGAGRRGARRPVRVARRGDLPLRTRGRAAPRPRDAGRSRRGQRLGGSGVARARPTGACAGTPARDRGPRGDRRERRPTVPGLLLALRLDQPRTTAGAGDRGRALGRPVHPRAAVAAGPPAARRRAAAPHPAHRRGPEGPRRRPADGRARPPRGRPRRTPATDPRGAGPADQRHPRRTPHPLAPRPGLRPGRGQPVLRRGAARPQPDRRAAADRARPAAGAAGRARAGHPSGAAHRRGDRPHHPPRPPRGGRRRLGAPARHAPCARRSRNTSW